MARAIIVTVGISLIQDYILEREGQKVGFEELPSPIRNLRGLDAELRKADGRHARATGVAFNPAEGVWVRTRAQMVAALDRIGADPTLTLNPLQRQQYLGAELASLRRLGVDKQAAGPEAEPAVMRPWERLLAADDAVTLLVSDTAPGIFCAGVIQEVLREGRAGFPKVAKVDIAIATGLRPESRELFLASGLPSAAEILFEARRKHGEALLVGSGGYKGLLPYLLPVAMHLRVPVLYLYEDSQELLEIQPLPLTLDLDVIRRNRVAFKLLWDDAPGERGRQQRQTCPAAKFWQAVCILYPSDVQIIKDLDIVEEFRAVDTDVVRLRGTGVLARLLAGWRRMPAAQHDATPTWETEP